MIPISVKEIVNENEEPFLSDVKGSSLDCCRRRSLQQNFAVLVNQDMEF